MPSILSNTLRYRMPSIPYEIHYGTECQAYRMQYTGTKCQAYCMQYTMVQNAKHTVCNTLRYRMPSILYEIHYGTEYQAYCMQYTTVQNANHNETDCHDITEILLKVALNLITHL